MKSLDHQAIRKAQKATFPGTSDADLHCYDEIASTSDRAIELGKLGAVEGTSVISNHQSAGRGRRGNAWTARPSANVLMSVVLRPHHPIGWWPRLTHLAGLAVADAIELQTGLRAQLKWPNDIFLGDRKVSGILLDAQPDPETGGFAIAGIGININTGEEEWPPEIADTATSLAIECGHAVDRSGVAAATLVSLGSRLRNADAPATWNQTLRELQERSYLRDKAITALLPDGRRLVGTVKSLGEGGELIVVDGKGESHVVSSADLVRLA